MIGNSESASKSFAVRSANDTAGVGSTSHLSTKIENSFYAEKLAGLRRKIQNIQSKHDKTIQNQTVEIDTLGSPNHDCTLMVEVKERSRSKSVPRVVCPDI